MKQIILVLLLFTVVSCREKEEKPTVTNTTYGKNSDIIITEKDTVFIHDTIYTSKHYDNVGTVNIGPQ